MTTEGPMTGQALLDSLKAEMQAAAASGDLEAMMTVAAKVKTAKGEIVKAVAERIAKETAALAGVRAKAAASIWNVITANKQLMKSLADTKAMGFTFKLDTPDVEYKAVSLTVPQPPTAKRQGGGGGTGKTKAEYGITLDEVFQKYATAEEKTALETIKATDDASGSKAWKAKVAVRKRAIAEGKLQPIAK